VLILTVENMLPVFALVVVIISIKFFNFGIMFLSLKLFKLLLLPVLVRHHDIR